jgi:hypothetical protein
MKRIHNFYQLAKFDVEEVRLFLESGCLEFLKQIPLKNNKISQEYYKGIEPIEIIILNNHSHILEWLIVSNIIMSNQYYTADQYDIDAIRQFATNNEKCEIIDYLEKIQEI